MEASLYHPSAESGISVPISRCNNTLAQNLDSRVSPELEIVEEAPLGPFSLFSLLPLELQRHIWRYAVLSPRIVEIHEKDIYIPSLKEHPNQETPLPLCTTVHHFASKTVHPPLLQTCRVSRMVALRFMYKTKDLGSIGCMKPVYFEFEVDTAFLSRETLNIWESSWLRKRDKYNNTPRFPRWSVAAHGMRQNLRSIAFGAEILTEQQATDDGSRIVPSVYSCKSIVGNLFQFGGLEEVFLVLNGDGKISSNRKLSTIRFFQPDPDTEVTILLQSICDILETEYEVHIKDLLCRSSNRQHQRGTRNRGWIRSPLSTRNPPKIKPKITKLRL